MLTRSNYLDNLTSLRGITALLVAVYHFEGLMLRFVPQASSMFFAKCYLMVDIFFLMSGFIITHVYDPRFQQQVAAPQYKKFIIARFARIYPMHLFVLLIVLISFVAAGSPSSPIQNPNAILSNLLLVHSLGIHDTFTWNVPSWSISAEWWCYVLFPFLIVFLNRMKGFAMGCLFVLSVLIYLSIMYRLPRVSETGLPLAVAVHDLNVSFDYGFIRGLAGFTLGILLYKFYKTPVSKQLFSSDWLLALLITAAVLCMHFAVPDIVNIPLFAGIVICAACNDGIIHKILDGRVLKYLGDISYSIYMLHVVVIFTILEILKALDVTLSTASAANFPFWPGLLACLAFLGVVIALSALTYEWVEKPCRDFINRWASRTDPGSKSFVK